MKSSRSFGPDNHLHKDVSRTWDVWEDETICFKTTAGQYRGNDSTLLTTSDQNQPVETKRQRAEKKIEVGSEKFGNSLTPDSILLTPHHKL